MTKGVFSDSITIMVKEHDTDDKYELGEAARELGISIATLFRWMSSGKIVAIRIYRRTFISKSEVERLKNKATVSEP